MKNTNPTLNPTLNPNVNLILPIISNSQDSKYPLEVHLSCIGISRYFITVTAVKKYKKLNTHKVTYIHLCKCTVSTLNRPLRLYAWYSLPPPPCGHMTVSRPVLANRVEVNGEQKYTVQPRLVQEYNTCMVSLTSVFVLVTSTIFVCVPALLTIFEGTLSSFYMYTFRKIVNVFCSFYIYSFALLIVRNIRICKRGHFPRLPPELSPKFSPLLNKNPLKFMCSKLEKFPYCTTTALSVHCLPGKMSEVATSGDRSSQGKSNHSSYIFFLSSVDFYVPCTASGRIANLCKILLTVCVGSLHYGE
jgi:hypothetical protein